MNESLIMSQKDEFQLQWKARFPKNPAPTLTCLDSINRSNIQKDYNLSKEKAEKLKFELEKEEFKASFLWDLLHGVNAIQDNKQSPVVKPNDLDCEIPSSDIENDQFGEQYQNVQPVSSRKSDVLVQPKTTVFQRSASDRRAPSSQTVKISGVTVESTTDSLQKFKNSGLQHSGSLDRYNSNLYKEAMTDSEKLNAKFGGKAEDDGDAPVLSTFTGGSFKKKAPVPVPRAVFKGIEEEDGTKRRSVRDRMSQFEPAGDKEMSSLSNKATYVNPPTVPSIEVPTPKPSVAPPTLKPLTKKKPVKATPPVLETDLDSLETNVSKDVKQNPEHTSSFKSSKNIHNYSNVIISPGEIKTGNKTIKVDNADAGLDAEVSHADDEDADDGYVACDKGSTGKGDDEADVSSDEEEPIYFNIMMMKQQTMDKVNKDAEVIYASPGKLRGLPDPRNAEKKDDNVSTITNTSSGFGSCEELESDGLSPGATAATPLSGGSGQEFVYSPDIPDENGHQWKRQDSMRLAVDREDSGSMGSLGSEIDEADDTEANMTQMRKWVVTSILESETQYVQMLDIILQYMRSFNAAATTSQPLIPKEDTNIIFNQIPELHRIHSEFIKAVQPHMVSWSSKTEVGEAFKMLVTQESPVAEEYLKNYQKAVDTIHKYNEENQQFAELTKEIKIKKTSEISESLEELLHKPVLKIQRNALVIHDLIKCTPTSHTDYEMLQKTLKLSQHFLGNVHTPLDDNSAEQARYLVKNNMLVEKVNERRRLRHIFLFNDVIVCTKQKVKGQKLNFEVKWYIHLANVSIEEQDTREDKKSAQSHKNNIAEQQQKVNTLQSELRREAKKSSQDSGFIRQWSMRGQSGRIEKIKKRLAEAESTLVLEAPNLPFKMRSRGKKLLTLLMTSDYERNDWRETIHGLKTKAKQPISIPPNDILALVNNVALKLPKFNAISNLIEKDDWGIEEEHLFGSLNINIHKLVGLKKSGDIHCAVEVDSYGHFYVKAKTNLCTQTAEPVWNEDFEIDLDGAQTLRILCYQLQGNTDILIGKCALELSKAWLRGDFRNKSISINKEVSVQVSLDYASREQTLRRMPSSAKGGYFGIRLDKIAKRESGHIPLLIIYCTKEVEKRGLTDVGIYRISGLSSEIQRVKKAFEKNVKLACQMLKEVDINVVTGLVKLYMRELPEAVFTDKLYPQFVKAMDLSDAGTKKSSIKSLIQQLPECNFQTVSFVVNHLVKVSENEVENKMTLQNLATVFGPTMLRPSAKASEQSAVDLFTAGARDAMLQTSILYLLLQLRIEEGEIVRPNVNA